MCASMFVLLFWYKKSGTGDLHSGFIFQFILVKEPSFFRFRFDWTHSSRCFVSYKSSLQKPHAKHVLSERTRFL